MMEENDRKEQPDSQSRNEKGFIEEVLGESLDLDRGLLATIIYMLKAPGEVIDAYFHNRGRFTNPFRFAFVILAFTTLISTFFIDYESFLAEAFEAGAGQSLDEMVTKLESITTDFDWRGYFENVNEVSLFFITKATSVLYIVLLAPCFSLFSWLFFKERKNRFIEHFVMNLYGLTEFALFSIVTLPIIMLMPNMGQAYSIVTVILITFSVWIYKNYLNLSGAKDYTKGIVSILLGYIFYAFVNAVVTYVVALVKTLYFD